MQNILSPFKFFPAPMPTESVTAVIILYANILALLAVSFAEGCFPAYYFSWLSSFLIPSDGIIQLQKRTCRVAIMYSRHAMLPTKLR